ncbi:cell wall-binding repeat-containing protein [Ornithinimicrobium faecis]|uniref:Cell wall-binding repeat-containing protein n=1 Tax=Ornithinimicrobium faecis TaxID=2934158 RepID=A0ABY4YTX3_9MICO|nr:cell wall-binding repeat-containing protein [Ornithinimicrobium sp. HY1793]USQ80061.1 cell wall-binding repeat-containing protein [Ornithinimicrobium sp. HY1793]
MALTLRTARRGIAALTGIVVAASLTTSTASTAPLPTAETAPQESTQAARWTGGLDGQAPCPEGSSRDDTLLTESFTNGIPHNDFNNGWRRVHSGIGGTVAVRSEVNGGDQEDWMFTRWATAPVGAQTMLAFTSRGNVSSSNYSRADVNSLTLHAAADTGDWRGKVFDITAATDDEGGRLGPWFQHRSRQGASQWWDVDNVQIYTCAPSSVYRIEGESRYDTSAAIAEAYPQGVGVVYLASGTTFPDALTGAALAGKLDAPVLLVQHDKIPAAVTAQLQRLAPGRIVALGGSKAISDNVLQAAAEHTSGDVTRLAGADRYETAAAIADTYPSGISTAYIASGATYPDALSGSASAARNGRPLLLANSAHLPQATRAALERLKPGRIVILGGAQAVSNGVQNQLEEFTAGDVTRIAGANRYETSALIADTFPGNRDRVFVATGLDFPDALSGSALAGKQANPVLLAQPSNLPNAVGDAIAGLNPDNGVVLGGYTSVNSIVLDQLGRRVG